MDEYDKNIDSLKNFEVDFKTSENELWAQIEKATIDKPKSKTYNLNWVRYAVAASIALLLGIGLFMRLYTIELATQKAEQMSFELPDGSSVILNAASLASYHPYWWNFNREIKLNGEAFFKVAKGEKFSVISEEGTTSVLGTSFNVFARENTYRVFCKTGKVSVSSNKFDIKYQIIPGELAVIDNLNKSGSKKSTDERDYLAWTYNKFSFTNASLVAVFNELERQYNIQIEYNIALENLKFGAYFEKPEKVEEALELIAMQFNLNIEKTANNQFKVLEK